MSKNILYTEMDRQTKLTQLEGLGRRGHRRIQVVLRETREVFSAKK